MSCNIKLIGLVGHKQSGKDTCWSIICKLSACYLTKCPCYKFAFADGVKHEVAAKLGTTVDYIESHKNDPLVRHILQYYGTEIVREQNNNYWIDLLAQQIEKYKSLNGSCANVVVTDVRFLNEAAYIKSNGGLLFRIRRQVADQVLDLHQSEWEVDSIACDNFIDNNMSFLRLECEVKDVLKQHNLLK